MTKHEAPWWTAEEEAVHERVFSRVSALEERQSHVHDLNVKHAKVYGNCDPVGLDWTLKRRSWSREDVGKFTLNVTQSVADTATALIAKHRPRAVFTTDGAEWSMQRKAVKLEKFVDGIFDRSKVYVQAVKAFRDAVIFGTGALKVYHCDGQVHVERVLIDEIVVDELEARSADPTQIHQRKWVDVDSLLADYEDKADQILRAVESPTSYGDVWGSGDGDNTKGGQVVVVESWRLPAGDVPGRHAICIEGCTLFVEEWDLPRFPFAFYRWTELPTGFYGQGLVEQLIGIQLNINKLNRHIDRCMELMGNPMWMVPNGSRVLKGHLTSEVGHVVQYAGQRHPTVYTPPAVPPDVYQKLETEYRRAFEIAGISQFSAQSKKPLGLESGAALREFVDIETERFSIQAQGYETMFMDVSELVIMIARDNYASGDDDSVKWRDRRFARSIKWSDVDMERDKFVISIEAASILSKTPAGRKQDVIDLSQAGLISTSEARRLMNHADLDRAQTLANAAIEHAEWTIEKLLDGEWVTPDPMMDLTLASQRVQAAYLKATQDGAPDDVLELLLRWVEKAKTLLSFQAQMAAQEAQATQMLEQAAVPDDGQPRPEAALAPEAMFTTASSTRSV